MLIKVLVLLGLAAAGLAVFVAMQKPDFRVSRAITIHALPEAIFPLINDFHRWNAWSPWADLDPAMKQTFEGSPAGEGAGYLWQGNSRVGEGRMTLIQSRPVDLLRIRLQFAQPIRAENLAEFTLQPQGLDTVVTWTMTGKNNFLLKAVRLVMNMDKMLGRDFENGLARMKEAAERSSGAH